MYIKRKGYYYDLFTDKDDVSRKRAALGDIAKPRYAQHFEAAVIGALSHASTCLPVALALTLVLPRRQRCDEYFMAFAVFLLLKKM